MERPLRHQYLPPYPPYYPLFLPRTMSAPPATRRVRLGDSEADSMGYWNLKLRSTFLCAGERGAWMGEGGRVRKGE